MDLLVLIACLGPIQSVIPFTRTKERDNVHRWFGSINGIRRRPNISKPRAIVLLCRPVAVGCITPRCCLSGIMLPAEGFNRARLTAVSSSKPLGVKFQGTHQVVANAGFCSRRRPEAADGHQGVMLQYAVPMCLNMNIPPSHLTKKIIGENILNWQCAFDRVWSRLSAVFNHRSHVPTLL